MSKVFETPERSDIEWNDVESLFKSLGGKISEGRGSRVRVHLLGVRAVFHRPHPQKETNKGTVKSVRRYFSECGVNEDGI